LALVHEIQPFCDNIYVVPQLWGLPIMNLQVDGFLRERVMMLKLPIIWRSLGMAGSSAARFAVGAAVSP